MARKVTKIAFKSSNDFCTGYIGGSGGGGGVISTCAGVLQTHRRHLADDFPLLVTTAV